MEKNMNQANEEYYIENRNFVTNFVKTIAFQELLAYSVRLWIKRRSRDSPAVPYFSHVY